MELNQKRSLQIRKVSKEIHRKYFVPEVKHCYLHYVMRKKVHGNLVEQETQNNNTIHTGLNKTPETITKIK